MAHRNESLELIEDIFAIMGEGPQAMFWRAKQMDKVLRETQRLANEKPHIHHYEGDSKQYLAQRMMKRMMGRPGTPPHLSLLLSSMGGGHMDMANMMGMLANAAQMKRHGATHGDSPEPPSQDPVQAILPEPEAQTQMQQPIRNEPLNLPGVQMNGQSIRSRKRPGMGG